MRRRYNKGMGQLERKISGLEPFFVEFSIPSKIGRTCDYETRLKQEPHMQVESEEIFKIKNTDALRTLFWLLGATNIKCRANEKKPIEIRVKLRR